MIHSRVDGLRRALRPVYGVALLHGTLAGLTSVNLMFGLGLIVLQPLSIFLLILAGGRLSKVARGWGLALLFTAAVYGFAMLLMLLAGEFAIIAAVGWVGPMMSALTFLILGLATNSFLMSPRQLLPALPIALNALGAGGMVLLGRTAWGEDVVFLSVWVIFPQVAVVASALWLWTLTRKRPGEDLLHALAPTNVELLDETLPIRVRRRIPCQVPHGLRVSSPGEGVTLHNPVLDQLLELSTTAPAAVSSMLSENEDTVLALLHRFPDSRLEEDAVVFEASAELLVEEAKGRPVNEVLAEGVEAAEALAVLLEGNEP